MLESVQEDAKALAGGVARTSDLSDRVSSKVSAQPAGLRRRRSTTFWSKGLDGLPVAAADCWAALEWLLLPGPAWPAIFPSVLTCGPAMALQDVRWIHSSSMFQNPIWNCSFEEPYRDTLQTRTVRWCRIEV